MVTLPIIPVPIRSKVLDDDGYLTLPWQKYFSQLNLDNVADGNIRRLPALANITASVQTVVSTDGVWTDLAGMTETNTYSGGPVIIIVSMTNISDATNSDYDIGIFDGANNLIQSFYFKNPFASVGNTLCFSFADSGRIGSFTYKLRAKLRQALSTVAFGTPDLMQILRVGA